MKKTYIQPSVNVVAFAVNCSILNASGIVNGGGKQTVVESDGDDWAD